MVKNFWPPTLIVFFVRLIFIADINYKKKLFTIKFSKLDAGSIFCGAELVKWMVQNIDGVENEDDAETLGQLLLDKGALFHTEGSK